LKKSLRLRDGFSIIIGIVVGATIFRAPPLVFQGVTAPWQALLLWAGGGAISLIGALCYAELASTYLESGGDYVFLTRAFGRPVGFVFGWCHLTAVQPGTIGALAFVFADYALRLVPSVFDSGAGWAVCAVLTLSVLNLFGVEFGKGIQNALTVTKLAGLACVVVAGLLAPDVGRTSAVSAHGGSFSLALVLVLYAYGGWNDAAFIAAEVQNPRRNIPRALIGGTLAVTIVYLAVNAAYLRGLGFDGVRSSTTPAADTVVAVWGQWGAGAVSVLVIVAVLGALNGVVFTGCRVYASLGADHRLFGWLGQWHQKLATPLRALVTQTAIALAMIAAVGTATGRSWVDRAALAMGLVAPPWERFGGGFDTLVSGAAPIFWLFFLLTGLSIFVLRAKGQPAERGFSVPLYPVTPVGFCLFCGYMLLTSVTYARELALLMSWPVLLGFPLYWISERLKGR